MRPENGKKVQNEYQIVANKNITSVLKCWLCRQEVASSVTTGIYFYFIFLFCI